LNILLLQVVAVTERIAVPEVEGEASAMPPVLLYLVV
jgi:hypothetical protein